MPRAACCSAVCGQLMLRKAAILVSASLPNAQQELGLLTYFA